MTRRGGIALAVILVGLAARLNGAEPAAPNASPATAPTSPEDVARLVQMLDAGSYAEREQATQQLADVPAGSYHALQATLAGKTTMSPEARARLERALPQARRRYMIQRDATRVAEYRAWKQTQVLGAYRKKGVHNAKWDRFVEAALTLYVDGETDRPEYLQSLDKVLRAGCRDGVIAAEWIKYAAAMEQAGQPHTSPELFAAARAAAQAGLDSDTYSEAVRAIVISYGTSFAAPDLADAKDNKRVELVDRALHGDMPVLAKEALMESLALKQSVVWGREMATKLAAEFSDDPTVLAGCIQLMSNGISVRYEVNVKGDVRTEKSTYGAGAEEGIEQCRRWEAHVLELDPENGAAPAALIRVLGNRLTPDGHYLLDDPEVPAAFERALANSAGNRDACNAMLSYVYNHSPSMSEGLANRVAFARKILARGDFAGSAEVIVTAHMAMDGLPGYYAQPDIWQDLTTYYKGYLKIVPEDDRARTLYLRFAVLGSHWKAADDIRKALKKPDPREYASDKEYARWMRQIDRHLKAGILDGNKGHDDAAPAGAPIPPEFLQP